MCWNTRSFRFHWDSKLIHVTRMECPGWLLTSWAFSNEFENARRNFTCADCIAFKTRSEKVRKMKGDRKSITSCQQVGFHWFRWEFRSRFKQQNAVNQGADYMANFSPVSRAEISPRPPDQIFSKTRLRLHGENFSPGWNSAQTEIYSPVCETGLGFSARAEIQKNLMQSHWNFSPGWKVSLGMLCDCAFNETRWRILTFPPNSKFQPGLKFVM